MPNVSEKPEEMKRGVGEVWGFREILFLATIYNPTKLLRFIGISLKHQSRVRKIFIFRF